MGNNLFTYIRSLELLAFFSGYPLIYFLMRFLAGTAMLKMKKETIVSALPFSYALTGTLYLGLQLVNVYPDYSIENLGRQIQLPYMSAWALLSILFWIPALAKKQIISLLHSLVFFLILLKNIIFQMTLTVRDPGILRNLMTVYTISILLNLSAFIIVLLFSLQNLRKKSGF